ncbi:MAG TPA: hypothetical protein VKQ72_20660 [Aggregatilineales bacterium]|nr:hypothetical protein [Aggregatilineales bacterium]
MDSNNLPQAVKKLFGLLHERKIAYLLVGGIALLQYIEGRNTEDIDLIMALSSLKELPEIRIHDQNMYFAHGEFDILQIDVLLTENPLFKKIQQEYVTTQQFFEETIRCATIEGLLLLKLYALPSLYRQGNFARVGLYENDIATLLHDHHPPIAPLLAELGQYLTASDLKEVKAIVADIQRRIERFERGHQSHENKGQNST